MLSPVQRRQFLRLFLLSLAAMAQIVIDLAKRAVEAREVRPDRSPVRPQPEPAGDGLTAMQSAQIDDFLRRLDRCDDC